MSDAKKSSTIHPDNVFLISGTVGEAITSGLFAALNKDAAVELSKSSIEQFEPVSAISLSEMRAVLEMIENSGDDMMIHPDLKKALNGKQPRSK